MKSKQVQADPKNQGEGNREAARRYNAEQKKFVDSGRAPDAARRAAPQDEDEAAALKRAEDKGRSRAKGEDPTVPGANAARQHRD